MTVYKPAEDTYLVLEYIEDLDLEDKKVLDMGTGNGEIAMKAAEKGAKVTAADVNPEALNYAREKAEDRNLDEEIDFIESDLFENIDQKYDLIIFNPPYLPGKKGIGDEEIWRGGEKGSEVTEKFLEALDDYLKEEGFGLIVASSLANTDFVEEYGLEKVDEVNLWFEDLTLYKSTRP